MSGPEDIGAGLAQITIGCLELGLPGRAQRQFGLMDIGYDEVAAGCGSEGTGAKFREVCALRVCARSHSWEKEGFILFLV